MFPACCILLPTLSSSSSHFLFLGCFVSVSVSFVFGFCWPVFSPFSCSPPSAAVAPQAVEAGRAGRDFLFTHASAYHPHRPVSFLQWDRLGVECKSDWGSQTTWARRMMPRVASFLRSVQTLCAECCTSIHCTPLVIALPLGGFSVLLNFLLLVTCFLSCSLINWPSMVTCFALLRAPNHFSTQRWSVTQLHWMVTGEKECSWLAL